jgi:hypothetical protein
MAVRGKLKMKDVTDTILVAAKEKIKKLEEKIKKLRDEISYWERFIKIHKELKEFIDSEKKTDNSGKRKT